MFLMKRLALRTRFSLTPSSLPSPQSNFIAQCFSSSPSHLTYPHSQCHLDSRNVRVSAWWDIDKCKVPSGVNVLRGAQAIKAAIRSCGIQGPINITAFGDILRLAVTTQKALYASAINYSHIPPGGDCSAEWYLLRDLMDWVSQNPPPAHLFLITGGSPRCLHQLRLKNYNILLATKESAPAVVCSAATIMCDWDALIRGENLTGRYFNQPPNDSWYGHYEGPLEDAFAPDDQPVELLQQKHSKSKTHEVSD